MEYEKLLKLPKVELHCHLDGSLSQSWISRELGMEVDASRLQVTDGCQSLKEYLEKFDLPIRCIQTEGGLRRAGYDFLQQVSRENMRYVEVRFAPACSAHGSLTVERVLESLLTGLEEGKKAFGTEYNVIVCAMRHHSEEENLAMLKSARTFLGQGVCCADLAGDEAAFPMSGFRELFSQVKAMGMPFVLHAGECGSRENIQESVDCGAARIGHGIAMRGDGRLQELCRKKGVGIEMCPISNLQTKAVGSKADYPMREFLDNGLLVTVNTDNRTVSDTSVTKELAFIQENYGITDEEIYRMLENGARVSFADDGVKHRLLEEWKRR
ncbi:MAG: adenosine deaminase [Eubacteriales bacterium]|nr:adenosine deaminase [Eubacteriales bacterium]